MIGATRTCRHVVVFCIVCVLIFSSPFFAAAGHWRVKKVIDGDSILFENNQQARYIGIDTPEMASGKNGDAQPFAIAAKSFNHRLVAGRNVRIEYDEEKADHYGRHLLYVFLPDGTFVNEEMIREGYAFFLYTPTNEKYAQRLLKAQHQAMMQKKGIWRRWLKDTLPAVTGNRNSKRFHSPGCPFGRRMQPSSRVHFPSAKVAFRQGYAPCRRCGGGIPER